jgi:predicted anti-sigma-YlaC factor YlaD
MKCKEARKVLSRYLDRELAPPKTSSLETHLADCIGCRTELETQRRVWALLDAVEPIPTPYLVAAIEARLSKPRWLSFPAGLRLRSFAYATATVALVVLFAGAGVWAAAARHASSAREHDRTFAELLSDAPPGMEVVTVLDQIGE